MIKKIDYKIPFNVPAVIGKEIANIEKVINENKSMSGNGEFTKKCHKWIEENTSTKKCLLTHSCTSALEMAALLIEAKQGDEIIMPSYTFVSSANAFALRGMKIVFVDINPLTMNIDENEVEKAITKKTKAVVSVQYAGTSPDMDRLLDLCKKHNIYLIEDAAQGLMADYKGKSLGSIGDLAAFSFHETKNIQCGEGGALLINNEKFIEKAEIVWEKGTDRSKFLRGQVDKYSWIDLGSSYLMGEIDAAFLLVQLENAEKITKKRLDLYERYYNNLIELEEKSYIELPKVPSYNKHNAHIFYIKLSNISIRQKVISHLKNNNIQSVFHYVPLHSSKGGLRYARAFGKLSHTNTESERLLRLPMFYSLMENEVDYICEKLREFFN